jgi:hypothetical protein
MAAGARHSCPERQMSVTVRESGDQQFERTTGLTWRSEALHDSPIIRESAHFGGFP